MAIPQLNKDQRPREKLLSKGVKALSDAQIMAGPSMAGGYIKAKPPSLTGKEKD